MKTLAGTGTTYKRPLEILTEINDDIYLQKSALKPMLGAQSPED
jgi:hypothetical protein